MKNLSVKAEPRIEIVPFSELRQDPKVLCQLVYDTIPTFYELIPGDRERKLELILAQLKAPKTELSPAQVVLVDDEIAGYISYFLGDELAVRQFNGVTMTLNMLNADERKTYLDVLGEHRSHDEPFPRNVLYLARMAVRFRYLPSGVTAHLMKHYFESFRDTARYGGYIVKENIRAQKYFEKMGFRKAARQSEKAGTFLYVQGVPEAI